jgi:hypothetical protein
MSNDRTQKPHTRLTWPLVFERQQEVVVHPIEDMYTFSMELRTHNRIQLDIDMSYDNSHVSVLPTFDIDNNEPNRQRELFQVRHVYWHLEYK